MLDLELLESNYAIHLTEDEFKLFVKMDEGWKLKSALEVIYGCSDVDYNFMFGPIIYFTATEEQAEEVVVFLNEKLRLNTCHNCHWRGNMSYSGKSEGKFKCNRFNYVGKLPPGKPANYEDGEPLCPDGWNREGTKT